MSARSPAMLSAAKFVAEHKLTVASNMIALFIFTRFLCTPTHVQLYPSSNFALRRRLPKQAF